MPRPVTLCEGSCEALGDAIDGLREAVIPAGEWRGQASAVVAEASYPTVPFSLRTLLDEPHALAVGASPDTGGTVTACGDLGGVPDDAGGFAAGLGAGVGVGGGGATAVGVGGVGQAARERPAATPTPRPSPAPMAAAARTRRGLTEAESVDPASAQDSTSVLAASRLLVRVAPMLLRFPESFRATCGRSQPRGFRKIRSSSLRS